MPPLKSVTARKHKKLFTKEPMDSPSFSGSIGAVRLTQSVWHSGPSQLAWGPPASGRREDAPQPSWEPSAPPADLLVISWGLATVRHGPLAQSQYLFLNIFHLSLNDL